MVRPAMWSNKSNGIARIAVGMVMVAIVAGCTHPLLVGPGATPSTSTVTTVPPVQIEPPQPVPTAALTASFDVLAATVPATVEIAFVPVGGGPVTTLGHDASGNAWSMIKVPLVLAVQRAGITGLEGSMASAIQSSDNSAADTLWDSLGSAAAAAEAVEAVLSSVGGVVAEVPPYQGGLTQWSTQAQAQFASSLACTADAGPVLASMTDIVSGQRWGLGAFDSAAFKGGWGPDGSGDYSVRQFGVLHTSSGRIGIAVAAQPESGGFGDGTHVLDVLAEWIGAHLAEIPGGRCA